MNSEVDLSQLAVQRDDGADRRVQRRRPIVTRYVLPGILLMGFVALTAWAVRDVIFPPKAVEVVRVLTTHSQVRTEGAELFKASGWVEPRPTPVRAAALAPGVVEKLLVVEDQVVEAGEPVAELVSEDAELTFEAAQADVNLRRAELEEAQATLSAAKVRVEQPVHLEAPLREAEAALASVETQLENLPFEIRRAKAEYEFAENDYDRKLAAKAAISGRSVGQAAAQLEAAQAVLEGLKRKQRSLENEQAALGSRTAALRKSLELKVDELQSRDEAIARLQAAKARVKQAEVAAAEAKLRLDRMIVRAPVSGRVLNLVAYPGARVMGEGAGGEMGDVSTVVTMYRPESLQVRVDVRFEHIPLVVRGQPVVVESPAVADPIDATVLFVSSEADIQKNTLEVKVALDAPPSVLKPEMLVDVTFLAPPTASDEPDSEELRLMVPRQLVQEDEAGTYVWLADRSDGVARKAPIEIRSGGLGELVEVVDGLNVASHLIAGDHDELEDGMRIRVTGEAAPLSMATARGPEQPRQQGTTETTREEVP